MCFPYSIDQCNHPSASHVLHTGKLYKTTNSKQVKVTVSHLPCAKLPVGIVQVRLSVTECTESWFVRQELPVSFRCRLMGVVVLSSSKSKTAIAEHVFCPCWLVTDICIEQLLLGVQFTTLCFAC